MEKFIGCSGWSYPDWKGVVYPESLPASKWFSHYATLVGTVEVNYTFYHFPKEKTIVNWEERAPKGFIYTLKAPRLITHIKRFSDCKKLLDDFYKICARLKDKLGCVLFQLPPSAYFDMAKLEKILDLLDPDFKNVLEFRHPSWWRKETYATLRKHSVIFCAVSAPLLPEDLIKTADEVYVRFHGAASWYAYDYSKAELAAWADKIGAARAKRVWAYFNNDVGGFAVRNSLELQKMLKRA